MLASSELGMSGAERNWADLPVDVLALIFQKLGSLEILFTAQAVCLPWKKLAYDPRIWRCIDFRNPWNLYDSEYDLEKMAIHAIDRSQGDLVEFSVEYFGSDRLIKLVAERTNILQCLRLISCYQIMDDALIGALERFPRLEELEISYCSFSTSVLETAGRLCPRLKRLKFNMGGFKPFHVECDEEAVSIADHMHNLQYLQLFGNKLTNDGLQLILRGCPHLRSLDLRQCFNVKLEGNWLKTCTERIKDLRLPYDPTEDDEFSAEINGEWTSDEDHPYGYSDIDSFSDDLGSFEFSDGSNLSDIFDICLLYD